MPPTFFQNYTFADLQLTENDLVKGMLNGEVTGLPDLFREVVTEAFEKVSALSSISCGLMVFEEVKFEEFSKKKVVKDVILTVQSILYPQLKKSEKIAVFACTAGHEISQTSRNYIAENDLIRGYVFDQLGSLIVESAMDKFQTEFDQLLKKAGIGMTNRFSPGYCQWNVKDQHLLFTLLPQNFCGITVSETAMMNPIKSISGIIGLGKGLKQKAYPCKKCQQNNCLYKQRKASDYQSYIPSFSGYIFL